MPRLVRELRSLNLTVTPLEKEEWRREVDRALLEAADEIERLNAILLAIAKEAARAVRPRSTT
ncbi:MAG: hypothetical protein JWN93_1164 [Hyphomicrobiales bacterium]|jgi:hypothetical protein|nr:hypothetical protein [Hyphomicrobiales bacterium]